MTTYTAQFSNDTMTRNSKREYNAAFRVVSTEPAYSFLYDNGSHKTYEAQERELYVGFAKDKAAAHKSAESWANRHRKAMPTGFALSINIEVVATTAS